MSCTLPVVFWKLIIVQRSGLACRLTRKPIQRHGLAVDADGVQRLPPKGRGSQSSLSGPQDSFIQP